MVSEAEPPLRRVLVIRFGRVGDMLVVTPALRALRQRIPGGRIEVLTTAAGAATLATNPNADSTHVLRWRRVPAALNLERARLVRRLRRARFDTIFLFETGERYRKLANAIGVPRVCTFARADEDADAFHARRGDRHEAQHFADVLALAGVQTDGLHYDYPVGDAARARAGELLGAHGVARSETLVGVHAGHFVRRRRRLPHPKAWPAERYVEVIRALANRGVDRVVLTGSPMERELNARIAASLPDDLTVDLAGATDLESLAAVIERCAVFIAPDTGPAHLAAAVRTPLVALFGPKAPHFMGPRGDETRIRRLYPEPADASKKERRGHHPRMWAITVADVLEAVDQMDVLDDA
jgi:ADP-heptose:LPS heptosyltransferase